LFLQDFPWKRWSKMQFHTWNYYFYTKDKRWESNSAICSGPGDSPGRDMLKKSLQQTLKKCRWHCFCHFWSWTKKYWWCCLMQKVFVNENICWRCWKCCLLFMHGRKKDTHFWKEKHRNITMNASREPKNRWILQNVMIYGIFRDIRN